MLAKSEFHCEFFADGEVHHTPQRHCATTGNHSATQICTIRYGIILKKGKMKQISVNINGDNFLRLISTLTDIINLHGHIELIAIDKE